MFNQIQYQVSSDFEFWSVDFVIPSAEGSDDQTTLKFRRMDPGGLACRMCRCMLQAGRVRLTLCCICERGEVEAGNEGNNNNCGNPVQIQHKWFDLNEYRIYSVSDILGPVLI